MGWFSRTRSETPQAEQRSTTFTLSDPSAAFYLGMQTSASNETVTERTSMGLTAVFRAVQIIAGTIASLPLHTYRTSDDGQRQRIPSWLDDPGAGVGMTPYEWVETLVAHLLLHGNAYGLHLHNGADALAGMQLLHPGLVTVELDSTRAGGRKFRVQVEGRVRDFTEAEVTHFRGLSTDGLVGYSPISACRNAVGAGIASEKAAGRMFSNGLLIGGVVTVPEDMDQEQAAEIQAGLQNRVGGTNRAGDIAVVNAALDFKPWTMNAQDAQFIEARGFQVEEIARLYGVPKVLLAEDGASTWGSGISELIRGFQKFTLAPLTTRIEQTMSRLMPRPRFAEFDYAGLLQPDHGQVVQNLAAEINAGTLTRDEARRILNRAPLADTPTQESAA